MASRYSFRPREARERGGERRPHDPRHVNPIQSAFDHPEQVHPPAQTTTGLMGRTRRAAERILQPAPDRQNLEADLREMGLEGAEPAMANALGRMTDAVGQVNDAVGQMTDVLGQMAHPAEQNRRRERARQPEGRRGRNNRDARRAREGEQLKTIRNALLFDRTNLLSIQQQEQQFKRDFSEAVAQARQEYGGERELVMDLNRVYNLLHISRGDYNKIRASLRRLSELNENEFTYNGAPSVTINFKIENNKVISFTLTEPGLILTAVKM